MGLESLLSCRDQRSSYWLLERSLRSLRDFGGGAGATGLVGSLVVAIGLWVSSASALLWGASVAASGDFFLTLTIRGLASCRFS